MMICEIASGDDTNGSGDDRLRNDDATSITSYHHHFAAWLHYNNNIYRAVPFLTLWLQFRVLPFWLSLFLPELVSVWHKPVGVAAFSPLANSPPAISPAANGPPAKSPSPPAKSPPLAYMPITFLLIINDIICGNTRLLLY